MGRKMEAAAGKPKSPASLHDAARKGDSRSLQKLLALIDPKAAEKVAAVLLERRAHDFSAGETTASVEPCHEKGTKTCTPRIGVEQGARSSGEKTTASPLKRLLQKQDAKRRTALYVACSGGNDDVVDTLLAIGASPKGHGAWQRTPLHIAAYEGHIAAVRTLLGAGADPWALNGRDQTPSDVSCMYNANAEILNLLDEAVNMRSVISTGAEGLAGATFVHDDGQGGTVADVIEQWSFTLEVELDHWVKVYLPVRGQRKLSYTRSSLDTLAGSISLPNACASQPLSRRCEPPIPWSAKAIGRMRLESDELLRITTGSLAGATARTPLGPGVVVAARNVSIRCEFETETRNNDETATSSRHATKSAFDTGDGQLLTSTKDIQACRLPSRATEHDEGSRGSQGNLSVDDCNGRSVGHGHNEGDTESPSRVVASDERHEHGNHGQEQQWGNHAMVLPKAPKRCTVGRVAHGSSWQGATRGSDWCPWVTREESCGGSADHDVQYSDDWDGCSTGTKGAARFDRNAMASANERTRGDWGELDCTPRQGSASCTRRHIFLDNLVPLVALESILDCQELPPSATTYVSRARRRRLLDLWNSRTSGSRLPAMKKPSHTSCHIQKEAGEPRYGTGSYIPTSEVDDLFYLGLGHGAFLASSRNEFGRSGNNAPVEMMGLEEQIEREEGSEERMDEKRSRIQATRSAVREALVLWSSKASLLQGRLTVLRTASTSTFCGSTMSAAENTTTSAMSLDEFLASPSPRCCACDKRGGYQKATSMAPASDKNTSDSIRSEDVHGRSQSSPDDRGSCPSFQSTNDNSGERLTCGDFRDGPKQSRDFHDHNAKHAVEREELLIAHLHECLKQMTHLRNWLRLLDNEIE